MADRLSGKVARPDWWSGRWVERIGLWNVHSSEEVQWVGEVVPVLVDIGFPS